MWRGKIGLSVILTLNVQHHWWVVPAMLVLSCTVVPATVCQVGPIEGKCVSSLQLLQLSFSLSEPGVAQHCWISITAADQSHWTALQHRAGGNHRHCCVFGRIWRGKKLGPHNKNKNYTIHKSKLKSITYTEHVLWWCCSVLFCSCPVAGRL